MKKEALTALGAVALVGFGFLLGDYTRLQEESAAEADVMVLEPQAAAVKPEKLNQPISKPLIEEQPVRSASPTLPTFNSGYADYPAGYFAELPKPLRMTTDQRSYRTRFAEAYAEPIDYGGSLVIAQIGCGTGCRIVYALDKSSGRIIDFPLGGEANMYLWIRYRADSSLIWATWEDGYPSDCSAQPWNLGASGFVPLSDPVGIDCDVARDSN